MDNKKHKFKKVKDHTKKFEVAGLHIEINAKKGGDLLDCYEPVTKDKGTAKKK